MTDTSTTVRRRRAGGRLVRLVAVTGVLGAVAVSGPPAANAAPGAAGIAHGFHSGTVTIVTERDRAGGYALVDRGRGGLEVRDLGGGFFQGPYSGVRPTDADNRWGTGVADDRATANVDAYYAAEVTWDYLRAVHGRFGIAGDGVGPLVLTNVGEPDGVASYEADCRCVLLSPPPAGSRSMNAIDVVAHEIGHGVSGVTAGFDNFGESGGLNEANSDILGTLVEFAAGNPADAPDYMIGESTPGGPLRYMDDPTRNGAGKGCWDPSLVDEPSNHRIGAPAIKFFYQLSVGSGRSAWGDSPTCGGAPAVTGLGNERAGRIWFRAVTEYMVSNTDYAGARAATLRAATDLYGPSSVEVSTVAAAWTAVGVDGTRPVPPAPTGPKIRFIGAWHDAAGASTYHYVQVTHPQRRPVTLTATGLPPGTRLDPGTTRISGTPTVAGEYPVTLTATDPDGNTRTHTLSWIVA
ncbi:M4 family metallopeptidase [Catenuloplanes atrovinosus]|uniref:Neutral metalloproteinase n=1 Tax=Catenuloplanes atrovinosus TaxID=137266 RepID=A0AAE3YM37_9ACTN|nr:M4 family metallopeptidase [Catenuloplanes atrovinosus]MDR7276308.1 hypothetical protein [Catenuloplanes atrovinosus]